MIVENYSRKILQTSYILLIRAIASNVSALTALAAHSRVGAVAGKVAGLIAVVAKSLVGAVAGKVASLVAVVAHHFVGAVASKVAGLVALAANHESLSLRASRMGAMACLFAQAHTSPQGSHEQCGRAFRSCSR